MGSHSLLQGIFLDPGIETGSPALQADSLLSKTPGKHIKVIIKMLINYNFKDFSGDPVVKTSPSNIGGAGSIPDQGAKTPHTSRAENQNRNTVVTHSTIKTFKKMVHIKKLKSE